VLFDEVFECLLVLDAAWPLFVVALEGVAEEIFVEVVAGNAEEVPACWWGWCIVFDEMVVVETPLDWLSTLVSATVVEAVTEAAGLT